MLKRAALLLVLMASPLCGAIAYVGGATAAGLTDPIVITNYTPGGNNSAAFVGAGGFVFDVTSVTGWGSSATKVTGVPYVAGVENATSAWRLVLGGTTSPSNVTVSSGGAFRQAAALVEFSGVNQITPVQTVWDGYSPSSNGLTITVNVASSTSALVVFIGMTSGSVVSSAPAGFTQRQVADEGVVGKLYAYSNEAPGTGSQTLVFGVTAGSNAVGFALEVNAVPTGSQERNMWLKDRLRLRLKGPFSLLREKLEGVFSALDFATPLQAQPMNGKSFGTWSRYEDRRSRVTPTPVVVPTRGPSFTPTPRASQTQTATPTPRPTATLSPTPSR